MRKAAPSTFDDAPREIYNVRVYGASIIATFAAVMIGYDSAFIGTSISLQSFKEEFNLINKTTNELNLLSANIVSLFQAGCFFGAIFGYPLGYFCGRKRGLVSIAVVFCIGTILQCVASSKTGLGIIYAGRVVAGLAIGAASNLAPIYVAEIAPPAIRGRLIGIYELCWQIGGVIGFWINYGVTQNIPPGHKQWLIAFAVQLIPGGLLLLARFFQNLPDGSSHADPKAQKAHINLSYLRGLDPTHPYLVNELAAICDAVEKEKKMAGEGFYGPLRKVWSSGRLITRLAIGASLFAWQNGTGINAVNYYSPTVFKSIGLAGTSTSLLTTGVFGIIKLIGSLVWLLYLVDTLGRRSVLMIGSLGGALCMYYIGAYIAIAKPQDNVSSGLNGGGIGAVVFFYLWTSFYSPSWNGTPWVITAEMFPQHVRTFTQACMAASNWLFGFLIARFTPQMFTKMGYGVYLFFASLMILSIFYVYLVVPETKKVPLERIEELFEPGVKPWKAYEIVMSQGQPNEERKK